MRFQGQAQIKDGDLIRDGIMDVVTGKAFNGRIQSTGNHADVEPKTAEDTKILCAMFGVTDASQIDYNRRAILVKATVGGTTYTYAASLYGEVHGSATQTLGMTHITSSAQIR